MSVKNQNIFHFIPKNYYNQWLKLSRKNTNKFYDFDKKKIVYQDINEITSINLKKIKSLFNAEIFNDTKNLLEEIEEYLEYYEKINVKYFNKLDEYFKESLNFKDEKKYFEIMNYEKITKDHKLYDYIYFLFTFHWYREFIFRNSFYEINEYEKKIRNFQDIRLINKWIIEMSFFLNKKELKEKSFKILKKVIDENPKIEKEDNWYLEIKKSFSKFLILQDNWLNSFFSEYNIFIQKNLSNKLYIPAIRILNFKYNKNLKEDYIVFNISPFITIFFIPKNVIFDNKIKMTIRILNNWNFSCDDIKKENEWYSRYCYSDKIQSEILFLKLTHYNLQKLSLKNIFTEKNILFFTNLDDRFQIINNKIYN